MLDILQKGWYIITTVSTQKLRVLKNERSVNVLDERKKKILKAIIDNYIDTAEPTGSKTLEKKYNLGLSSATIRNEMADLEELGYLSQPHTSSGRVPSLSGYRLYVDELMTQYSLTLEEIDVLKSVMTEKVDYLEKIVKTASALMSDMTNYTTFMVAPKIKTDAIKNIRLVYIEENMLLAVIVTKQGIIKDKKILLDDKITHDELENLENSINTHISGIDFSEITMEKIILLVNEAGASNGLVLKVFEFIKECTGESQDSEVYINGSSNIFNYPEYRDVEKAKRFLKLVDSKTEMLTTINQLNLNNDGISISIGNENTAFEDCSIITSKYKIGDNMEGFIGIIGPVRMDYKKAVSVMKHVTGMVNSKMLEITSEKEEKTDGGKD